MSPSPPEVPPILDWIAGFGTGWVYLTVVGGGLLYVLVIVLVRASVIGACKPDHPLAQLAPRVLFPAVIAHIRWRAADARARIAAAIHRKRRAARVRQAERAALEAANSDPALAPASIRKAAEALLRLVYLAWDARDPERLSTLMSPDLLLNLERAPDADGRRSRARVPDDVTIDLVTLRTDPEAGATAVVLIEAELHDADDEFAAPICREGSSALLAGRLSQYWTLARGDGPWIVEAIEERADGDRHLRLPLPAHDHTPRQLQL